ncbi:ribosome recycling factor [Fodinibius halophilus]|uniref:Ribosome-recycling factor n=1 Tax=Fodinibius halophilus TaxID=1736908 RepID=A0A6M1T8V2_9BACT|nr:ribosome recycling factor [Fodinibius halophilus]NGP89003.1 ribosome recycling factor [Fodinibius halophilus]
MIPPELQSVIKSADQEMDRAVKHYRKELSHIRAGKAQPSILDGVKVEYYGSQTPLNQLANVSAPEARLLTVQPFDKSALEEIEKAIMSAGLGLNPSNDGNIIRIPLPILSEERRKELVKRVNELAEEARISIRNTRRDANEEIEKKVKKESLPEDSLYEAEEEIQNLTDQHTEQVGELSEKKEKEIMTV